jgi:hypothetical protein
VDSVARAVTLALIIQNALVESVVTAASARIPAAVISAEMTKSIRMKSATKAMTMDSVLALNV